MFTVTLVLLLSFTHFVLSDTESSCFDNGKENLHQHLATKTGYKFIANLDDSEISYPGCRATKIWGLFRHGSRSPSKKLIKKMNSDLKLLRDQILATTNKLCSNDRERLKNWQPMHKDESTAKFLIETGSEELFQLGRRFKNRFPDLLSSKYSNDTHFFKYTLTQRAQKSAEAFADGLFQDKTSTDSIWYPEALHKDPVLRFYKACDRWKRDVDKNPLAYNEVELFSESDEMSAVVDELETRTGLTELTPQTVHLIYTTCAFETLDHQMSPWCALFTKGSISVVEFLEDLEYYWIDGYGYKLTYQQACAIGSDLMRRLEAEDPDITFYFTHSGTLLKTLAFLGLYKDDAPLTHKDFSFHERQWRAGKIDAFATNLVFVRFECSNKTSHILTMHQERIIQLPGCPADQDLCPLDTFKKLMSRKTDNCPFEQMCTLHKDEL